MASWKWDHANGIHANKGEWSGDVDSSVNEGSDYHRRDGRSIPFYTGGELAFHVVHTSSLKAGFSFFTSFPAPND